MAKRSTIDERLSAVMKARREELTPASIATLRAALGDSHGVLVEHAAKAASELLAGQLIPDLVTAFDRCLSGRVEDRSCLAATAVACLPELNQGMRDEPNVSQEISDFNKQLQQAQRPAVVFFHWQRDPDDPTRLKNPNAWKHEEVYNIDSAWPDDSPVVRVQDLGPRDIELVRYYAQRQPSRVFYRYQQDTRQLTRLGTATELRDDPRKLITPDMTATSRPTTQPKKSPDDSD